MQPGHATRDDRRLGSGDSILHELMTTAQIAAVLQLRVSTVEDYARRGVIPSIKLGRHRRYIRSQVEHAILQQLR